MQGGVLGSLANAYCDLGQNDRAAAYYRHALQICREIGNRMGEATNLNNLGTLHEDQGNYAAALDNIQQARAIYAQIGAADRLKRTEGRIARVRAKLGGGG